MYPGSKNPIASSSIRLKTLALTNLIILTFLLSSCSDDNPVKTTPPSDDTSRYTWDTTLAWNHMFWVKYAADSDNVYFVDEFYGVLCYHSNTFTNINLNDPAFSARIISGIDNDNIYIGGSNNYVPALKIIKHGQVSALDLNDYTGHSVSDLIVEGTNQLWISTQQNNKIYHLINGNLNCYLLDSGSVSATFYKDNSGKFFVFARRSLGNAVEELIYYRFTNDIFQKISSDTVDNNHAMSTLINSPIRNDCAGVSSIFVTNNNVFAVSFNPQGPFISLFLKGKLKQKGG